MFKLDIRKTLGKFKLKRYSRCLDRDLHIPARNPMFCHKPNPINSTFVMECCGTDDYCNAYLSPKLMSKTQGKKKTNYKTKFKIGRGILEY